MTGVIKLKAVARIVGRMEAVRAEKSRRHILEAALESKAKSTSSLDLGSHATLFDDPGKFPTGKSKF